LKLFLYKDGLARFATKKYEAPKKDNRDKKRMHLTNYAINKKSKKFIFNTSANDDNVGHKRSLKAVFKDIEKRGCNIEKLWIKIKKTLIKTLCVG